MADAGSYEVDLSDSLKTIAISVRMRVRPWTRLRLWVGVRIMALGARVAGFRSIAFTEEPDGDSA